MTIGEIKMEALRLMFANYATELYSDDENMDALMNNESYASYLVNMPGSINRALQEIFNKVDMPPKEYEIENDRAEDYNGFDAFNLGAILPDYNKIVRVDNLYRGEYLQDVRYQMTGKKLLLPKRRRGAWIVKYRQKVPKILPTTSNDTELDIHEYLCHAIPYAIKGDLYQDDEPNLAMEAKNWFEQLLAEYVPESDRNPSDSIDIMYGVQYEG
jgi:hypothetical protein